FDLILAHIGSDDEYGRIVDICTKWNKTKPGREGSLILITTEHFDTDLNLLKLKPIIINQPPTPSRLFDAVNSGKRDLHLPSGISMFEMAKAKTRGIKGARALLVEDVHTNQIVAVDMLEALGLHVAVVENGEEALNAIKQYDFDVVLMDFHMPVMDGMEATKKIRRFKSKKELAIIAMTAAAFAEDKKMALDCGMNAHISKPIQIYHLACVLAEHVHLKKSQSKKPPVLTKQQVPTFDITQFKDFVDVEAANENFSHNPRLFQSCLTHFVREFADWNEQVNDAVQQGDLTKVREAAHRLKGASANLFLTDINEQCSQLVNALDHSETAELNALQKALTRFLERIKQRDEFSDANVEAPQPKRVM
ncbi:MAG TPA: response regulator, partial [Rheinheimera sp.]|nr:response regulator [Rheinheimera sp.]